MELRSIYYDLDLLTHGPKPDDFLVSIGKKGIGTIYHIAESRKSKTRNRYNLKVYVANELKPSTRIRTRPGRWIRRQFFRNTPRSRQRIEVRGIHAWPLVWYPRNKK